jgi:extracellular factor (EF) 3-hydroxypalmitic acid methyl ester biosynthesis protein
MFPSEDFEYLRLLSTRGGPAPEEYTELDECFHRIATAVRSGVLDATDVRASWPALGDAFFSTQTIQGLVIRRPYGYAGDFETIDRIYTNWVSPDPRLSAWDRYLQQHKAPQAVRNRKRYFLDLLKRYLAGSDRASIRVLSVGSGPARECLEFFRFGQQDIDRVSFDLVDQDPAAIAYAQALNAASAARITCYCCRAQRFRPAETYDFIWSAGLFDYLSDRAFTALAGHLYRWLRPRGLLTIGNFAPTNPTRDYMEFGEWHLHYRTADDLYRLAFDCGLITDPNQLCVDSEPEDINLFLHVARPA